MSPALAESLLRQLLPEVAPQRFQHLMRIIRNDFFMLLDSRAMCRRVPPHASRLLCTRAYPLIAPVPSCLCALPSSPHGAAADAAHEA